MKSFLALVVVVFAALGFAPAVAATYSGTYSGANEVLPIVSSGTGSISVSIAGNTMTVTVSFSGISTPATAAHIHCCTPVGGNTDVAVPFFFGFPATTSGTYSNSFNLIDGSVYSSAFLTAAAGTAASAKAALIAGLDAGQAYADIHDAPFPGGEIRANLVSDVPEATTWLMMIAAFGFAGFAMRRRVPAV